MQLILTVSYLGGNVIDVGRAQDNGIKSLEDPLLYGVQWWIKHQ